MKLNLTRGRWIAGFAFAPLILALPARCLAEDAVIEAPKRQMVEMQDK